MSVSTCDCNLKFSRAVATSLDPNFQLQTMQNIARAADFLFDKILDLESIGDEDVEHSDTDVHHDSSSEEEIDDEDLEEHEIQAIKQQIALKKKEKVGRKIKEQIARRKQRERRHERLIKYRTHWLTKQKYKVGKMILDVEEERCKLTLHGLNSAMKELE